MLPAATDAVPIKTLLLTVFQSIAEVFLLCVAGYTLASAGVTDKATQRKLNVINVSLFTPALLFSKVAFSLTPAKLMDMWIIPLSFVLITGVSAGVAWSLGKIFKLSRSQRAFAICAAMFQNSNSLPIALVQSLAVEVPGLKKDKSDTKDQMLGRALAYLVVYSTLGMILRWSYGVQLLASADEEIVDKISDEVNGISHGNGSGNGNAILSEEPQALSGTQMILSPEPIQRDQNPFEHLPSRARSSATDCPRSGANIPTPGVNSPTPSLPTAAAGMSGISSHSLHDAVLRGRRPGLRHNSASSHRRGGSRSRASSRTPSRAESAREFLGLPDTPHLNYSRLVDLAEDSSESELETEDEWGAELPLLRRRRSPPREGWRAAWHNFKAKVRAGWTAFNGFMTVPTWAALLSIIIALIPPLQAWISSIRPFVAAVKSAGQCSIPVTLVVLGAFFYSPPPAISLEDQPQEPTTFKSYFKRKFQAIKEANKTESKYPGEGRTVFVACVSRMIIVPLIFLPFIAFMARYDPVPAAADPIFILCAVLLVSSPPALTLAQLTQAASGDAFERLISKTISISYAVLTPPLTLVYVVVGLFLTQL